MIEFCVSEVKKRKRKKRKGLKPKEQICHAIILEASPEKANAGKRDFETVKLLRRLILVRLTEKIGNELNMFVMMPSRIVIPI